MSIEKVGFDNMWKKEIVKEACRKFEGDESSIRLIGGKYQHVFEFTRNNEPCILKLFPIAVKDQKILELELHWMSYLRDKKMKIPKTIPSLHYVHSPPRLILVMHLHKQQSAPNAFAQFKFINPTPVFRPVKASQVNKCVILRPVCALPIYLYSPSSISPTILEPAAWWRLYGMYGFLKQASQRLNRSPRQ